MVLLHAGLILGVSMVVGLYPGFAKAGEVKEIQMQILDGQIFESREAHCKAATPAERALYIRRLNLQLEAYRKLANGYAPKLPDCRDFGLEVTAQLPQPR